MSEQHGTDLDGTAGQGHPDAEALSAYVDGNLEPSEIASVREHLLGCPACRTQVGDLQLVREVVRGLPFVEPPFGFYARTLRLGPRPRSGAAIRLGLSVVLGIVALVAVLAVVAVVRHQPHEVDPDVDVAASISGLGLAPSGPRTGAPTPPSSIQGAAPSSGAPSSGAPGAAAPDAMPTTIAGYLFAGVQEHGGNQYLLYGDGPRRLAVTWEDAELDEGRFPAGVQAEPVALADGKAWYVATDRVGVLFVQRGDRAYTVVVGLGADVGAIADALPVAGADLSALERVQSAGRSLLEAFGLGG